MRVGRENQTGYFLYKSNNFKSLSATHLSNEKAALAPARPEINGGMNRSDSPHGDYPPNN